ncbi:transposase zinc-binding domain-containing protein [Cystobacter fuscus]|uniref:transposase zinc-binding domain-containing protein n=1 Tax=Cystobacter fuscus TaxID=43 RepID=UPI000BB34A52
MRENLATLLAEAGELGRGLPRYVERDFARYLECGVLAHGFARVRCESCKDKLLVAFSCKGRGVCPSCNCRKLELIPPSVQRKPSTSGALDLTAFVDAVQSCRLVHEDLDVAFNVAAAVACAGRLSRLARAHPAAAVRVCLVDAIRTHGRVICWRPLRLLRRTRRSAVVIALRGMCHTARMAYRDLGSVAL